MGGARRLLGVAALFFACQTSLWAQNRIEWLSSWPEAQALAAQHHRLVLVHFWRPSCVACQKLERSVFNQPEFIRAVYGNYVAMSVNLADNPDAARHFGVQQTPTDIVLSTDGKELYRGPSPADMGRYIAMLDETAANARVNMPVMPPSRDARQAAAALPSSSPGGQFVANPGVGSSEFPLPPRGPAGGSPRVANPEYVTNQWAAPAGNAPAPPVSDQRASYTAANGGEFQPTGPAAGGAPTLPSSSAFPVPSPSAGTLGPPTNSSRTAEQPTYDAGSSMPYRGTSGFAPSGPPATYDRTLPPNAPLPDSAPSAPGRGAANGPPARAAELLPPIAGPKQDPPLGLDGYCPVTLVEHEKWVKGDPKFGAIHRGRLYLFASADAQAKFLQERGFDKYSPALSGYDPVKYAERGELIDGKRVHGVFYHGQVFLFSDEAGLQQFWADPERYATIVRAEHERTAARSTLQR